MLENRLAPRPQEGLVFAHQPRIAEYVPASRPFPASPEAAHAVLHVEEEALALLLPVVADGDAGLDLPGDDPVRRLPAGRREAPASTASSRDRRA